MRTIRRRLRRSRATCEAQALALGAVRGQDRYAAHWVSPTSALRIAAGVGPTPIQTRALARLRMVESGFGERRGDVILVTPIAWCDEEASGERDDDFGPPTAA